MRREDAIRILGLREGATPDEIRARTRIALEEFAKPGQDDDFVRLGTQEVMDAFEVLVDDDVTAPPISKAKSTSKKTQVE
jgi:hypothetical protein